MLSIRQIRELMSDFDEMDASLVECLAEVVPADECEITRRLHRLISKPDGWCRRNRVGNEGSSSELTSLINIEMRLHPTGWEKKVTSSDYGLVLSFEDEVLDRGPQTTAYLIQAKRLYGNVDEPRYDLRRRFGSPDEEQRLKHRFLETRLGQDAVKFGAYCPRLSAFDTSSVETILQLHEDNASALHTGTTLGLELQHQIRQKDAKISRAGYWIAPISPRLERAVDLHRMAFLSNLPFGWFVITNLWMLATSGNAPLARPNAAGIPHVIPWFDRAAPYALGLNFGQSDEDRRLTIGLARGEESAAEELARHSDGEIPKSRFWPAATLEIRMKRSPALDLHPSFELDHDDDPRPPRM